MESDITSLLLWLLKCKQYWSKTISHSSRFFFSLEYSIPAKENGYKTLLCVNKKQTEYHTAVHLDICYLKDSGLVYKHQSALEKGAGEGRLHTVRNSRPSGEHSPW